VGEKRASPRRGGEIKRRQRKIPAPRVCPRMAGYFFSFMILSSTIRDAF
jgi:hypothetical protein